MFRKLIFKLNVQVFSFDIWGKPQSKASNHKGEIQLLLMSHANTNESSACS